MSSTGDLYACGDDFVGPGYVWAAHSSDGGVTWPTNEIHVVDTAGDGPNLVITPDGTVYVFWQRGGGIQYAWLAGGTWSYSTNLGITFNGNGSINPVRFNGDDAGDWFLANSNPHYVFANGRIYLVYWDLPYTNSTTDRGDIFLVEATTNSNHWLGTPTVRKVNNDRTTTDQWDPSIAVNAQGTELFIGYYSRQNDPTTNEWIMAYGAKAYITNGLSKATFECFPISPTSFLPVFAGTNSAANTWSFDPVWPAANVCLDTNAVVTSASSCVACFMQNNDCTTNDYVNFCADDYTWASGDSNYFYYAWCDRSRTFGAAPHTRPDADVKFAKVKQ